MIRYDEHAEFQIARRGIAKAALPRSGSRRLSSIQTKRKLNPTADLS